MLSVETSRCMLSWILIRRVALVLLSQPPSIANDGILNRKKSCAPQTGAEHAKIPSREAIHAHAPRPVRIHSRALTGLRRARSEQNRVSQKSSTNLLQPQTRRPHGISMHDVTELGISARRS